MSTSPNDRSDLLAGATPAAPRVPKVGELLFEFLRGHDRIRCELRDHGEYGVEAQFMTNEELTIAHTFHQRLDPSRTPREMAIAWAGEWRIAVEENKPQPKTPLLQSVVRRMEEDTAIFNRTRHPDGRQKTEAEIRDYDERKASERDT